VLEFTAKRPLRRSNERCRALPFGGSASWPTGEDPEEVALSTFRLPLCNQRCRGAPREPRYPTQGL